MRTCDEKHFPSLVTRGGGGGKEGFCCCVQAAVATTMIKGPFLPPLFFSIGGHMIPNNFRMKYLNVLKCCLAITLMRNALWLIRNRFFSLLSLAYDFRLLIFSLLLFRPCCFSSESSAFAMNVILGWKGETGREREKKKKYKQCFQERRRGKGEKIQSRPRKEARTKKKSVYTVLDLRK